MNHIEETLKHCHKCKAKTKHQRNSSKSSGLAIIVHLFLILITGGVWLGIIIMYKLLTLKIGGWKCGECK